MEREIIERGEEREGRESKRERGRMEREGEGGRRGRGRGRGRGSGREEKGGTRPRVTEEQMKVIKSRRRK